MIEENPKSRQVNDCELDEFCHANNFIGWFSTSAKSGLNVKKGMNFMISKIIENKKRADRTNCESIPIPEPLAFHLPVARKKNSCSGCAISQSDEIL